MAVLVKGKLFGLDTFEQYTDLCWKHSVWFLLLLRQVWNRQAQIVLKIHVPAWVMAVCCLLLKFYDCCNMVKVIEYLHVRHTDGKARNVETVLSRNMIEIYWLQHTIAHEFQVINLNLAQNGANNKSYITAANFHYDSLDVIINLFRFFAIDKMNKMLLFIDSELSIQMLWSWINMTTSTISNRMQTGNNLNELYE